MMRTRPALFASADRQAAVRAALQAQAGAAGRRPAKPYTIKNATSATEAEVRIYDAIAWYAINAEEFAQELAAVTAPVINLRINSPGGSVFDGLAIYNTLKAHPAKVISHVDGLAASIASIIALAGEEVRMGQGAYVMIHNPWSLAIGDAKALRQEADLLDKVAGSLAGIYASRTGQSVADVQAIMDAETWWTAEEAVANGYATSLVEPPPADAQAKLDRFDLSLFAKVPAALQGAAPTSEEPPKTIREVEKILRDAGFSRAAAASIAAGGFKPTPEPRDEDESGDLSPLATLASDLRSLSLR